MMKVSAAQNWRALSTRTKSRVFGRRRPRLTTNTRVAASGFTPSEAQCQREGVVDFAELLLRSYELLQRNEPLRRHYQELRHILVDEFQDTNRLQYAWLKLLAGRDGAVHTPNGACLFAVGDDDQSIYAFRAEVGNMRDLEREFKVENVIRLEQNYRSHGNILDAANALIKNNRGRLGKNLWTDAGAGESIRVFEGFSDIDEARFVVDEARELVRDGFVRTQIALLYRPTPSRASLNINYLLLACRTGFTAGCASLTARRSSMRWPICA